MTFGEKIKELRKAQNLTIDDLSKKSGVCAATICLIENNHHKVSVLVAKRLSDALSADFKTLYRLV